MESTYQGNSGGGFASDVIGLGDRRSLSARGEFGKVLAIPPGRSGAGRAQERD